RRLAVSHGPGREPDAVLVLHAGLQYASPDPDPARHDREPHAGLRDRGFPLRATGRPGGRRAAWSLRAARSHPALGHHRRLCPQRWCPRPTRLAAADRVAPWTAAILALSSRPTNAT